MNLFVNNYKLSDIVEEQYYLTRYLNITPEESEMIPIFEKDAYITFLIRDKRKEKEETQK